MLYPIAATKNARSSFRIAASDRAVSRDYLDRYISFEGEADPETTTICNCTDCQTMSGAPFRALIITRPGIDAISGIGPKRTCGRIRQMSALGVRADIKIGGLHVR